jgi:hypothetical protein
MAITAMAKPSTNQAINREKKLALFMKHPPWTTSKIAQINQ